MHPRYGRVSALCMNICPHKLNAGRKSMRQTSQEFFIILNSEHSYLSYIYTVIHVGC